MLVMATVHGFLAGTDRSNRAVQWTVFVVLAVVAFLVAVRVLSPSRSSRRASPSAALREVHAARPAAPERDDVAV